MGHVFEHYERTTGQLRNGPTHVGALVQVHFLDADTLIAGGLDARSIVDQRRQLPFVQREYAILNVLRAHAGVGPNDANHRNIDLGKDVDRHPSHRAGAEQANERQHRDYGVRPPQNVSD